MELLLLPGQLEILMAMSWLKCQWLHKNELIHTRVWGNVIEVEVPQCQTMTNPLGVVVSA